MQRPQCIVIYTSPPRKLPAFLPITIRKCVRANVKTRLNQNRANPRRMHSPLSNYYWSTHHIYMVADSGQLVFLLCSTCERVTESKCVRITSWSQFRPFIIHCKRRSYVMRLHTKAPFGRRKSLRKERRQFVSENEYLIETSLPYT